MNIAAALTDSLADPDARQGEECEQPENQTVNKKLLLEHQSKGSFCCPGNTNHPSSVIWMEFTSRATTRLIQQAQIQPTFKQTARLEGQKNQEKVPLEPFTTLGDFHSTLASTITSLVVVEAMESQQLEFPKASREPELERTEQRWRKRSRKQVKQR